MLFVKLVPNLGTYSEAVNRLISELSKGEQSAEEKGWIDFADVEKTLGITKD